MLHMIMTSPCTKSFNQFAISFSHNGKTEKNSKYVANFVSRYHAYGFDDSRINSVVEVEVYC